MDVTDSTANFWLDVAQMDVHQDSASHPWQDEPVHSKTIEDPIHLFGRFVSVISSDTLMDIRPRTELSTFVRDLCVKAPAVAQYLVQEFLRFAKDDSQPEVPGSHELKTSTSTKGSSRRKNQSDRSYRLPRSSRNQRPTLQDRAEASPEVPGIGSQVGNKLGTSQTTCDTMQGSDRTMMSPPVPKWEDHDHKILVEEVSQVPQVPQEGVAPQEAVQAQSPAPDSTMLLTASESALHQLKATHSNKITRVREVARRRLVTLDVPAKGSRNGLHPPSPSEAEQQETALPEIEEKALDTRVPVLPHRAELHENTSPGWTPSTPTMQTGAKFQSSLSDDVTPQTALFTPIANREILSPLIEDDQTALPPSKVEMTLPQGIPSPPPSTQQQRSPCSTNSAPAQHVDREQPLLTLDSPVGLFPSLVGELPPLASMVAKAVDVICQMSRRQQIPTVVHSTILSTIKSRLSGKDAPIPVGDRPDSLWGTGSSTAWSASMWIHMLEAGYARSKEVTILNMIECMGASEWYDAELQQAEKAPPPTKRGAPRKRLATVILDKYLKDCDATAVADARELASSDSKAHPSTQDSTGVQNRILDARRKRLNNTFHRGRTLRTLVEKTHLGILFDSKIWNHAKASKKDVDNIVALFYTDAQKMELLSILDEQVELLVKEGRPDLSRFLDSLESRSIIPSTEILTLRAEYGLEREPVPQDSLSSSIDSVLEGIAHALGKQTLSKNDHVMVNGIELEYGMLDRLRSRDWLKCWDIAAALEMKDKPAFVQLGLGIPLHEVDVDGEVTPVSNPLRRWRTTIDNYRRKAENGLEGSQLYLCPLNINNNHFTLLEINEQTKMICHYNSMAAMGPLYRKKKSSFVKTAVEAEFKDLGFRYTEAPTPQQKDSWSCGLMVIRNAKRRMMGLQVGAWTDEVDPDRVIKDVLGDCQMFLEDGTLLSAHLPKKRKVVEEPSRSSKRLRELIEGSTMTQEADQAGSL